MKKILVSLAVLLTGTALLFGAYTKLVEFNAGFQAGYQGTTIKQIRMGITGAMTAGTITVADTNVTATSKIFLCGQNTGGTGGALRVSARTAGTNFTITSSSGTDTGTVAYMIMETTP